MRHSPRFKRSAIATSIALLAAWALPAAVEARIPGADDTGTVVITDSDALTVNIASNSGGRVTGNLVNRSNATMRCSVPGRDGRLPNQVTDARVVAAALEYYASNIFEPGGLEVPMIGAVGVGSVYDMMPTGSLSGSLGAATSDLVDLRNSQEAARSKGHTGTPYTGTNRNNWDISVNAGATVNWAADLGFPSTGTRPAFQAGALFFCEGGGKSYVFGGFEGGVAPTDPPPGIGPR